MPAIRLLLAACLLPLLAPPAAAYPVKPAPLWDLAARAELIVVAKVIEVVDLPDPDYTQRDWVSQLARLEVRETLKGEDVAYLKISYAGNLACPAPPDYRPGETVVAFLKEDEHHQLRTVALSYGTLYGRGESQLEDLMEMTRKAMALQAANLAGQALAKSKRAWALEAALRPGTRWHGLFELEPRTERMRKFAGYPPQPVGFVIAEHEQAVLAEAFLADSQPDRSSADLLEMLDGHQDPRLEAAALGWIEGLLMLEKPPYLTRDLIEIVLLIHGVADPHSWMTDDKGAEHWNLGQARLQQIWSKAKEHLHLPSVSPRKLEAKLL
jgi:hypothetical protein